MDKAEAIAVIRELFTVCPEIGQAVFVSLDPDSKGSYKIRLRISIDGDLKDRVTRILGAHKLEITETKDFAIIYSPTN